MSSHSLSQDALNMAYAIAFPASVTDLIYSYRDWRFEEVRRTNGTPTALAIKDLLTICANEQRICDAYGNGEEVDLASFWKPTNGYADALYLASFWWHAALEETHEECQRFYPEFMEEFQVLQQHREDTMRQLYFNGISTSNLLQE